MLHALERAWHPGKARRVSVQESKKRTHDQARDHASLKRGGRERPAYDEFDEDTKHGTAQQQQRQVNFKQFPQGMHRLWHMCRQVAQVMFR
jgi:hypothetical protein